MKIRVKVTPHAKQNSIRTERDLLTNEEVYMVRLTAKPVDGQANKVLIAYIADHFDVRKMDVEIVQGGTSRWKVLEIKKCRDD